MVPMRGLRNKLGAISERPSSARCCFVLTTDDKQAELEVVLLVSPLVRGTGRRDGKYQALRPLCSSACLHA